MSRCLLFSIVILAAAPAAYGQVGGLLEAQVVQIAGSTIYFDRGTDDGLAPGDTLSVQRDGTVIGRVALLSVAAGTSVAVPVESPFAVTRGETLGLLRHERRATPDVAQGNALADTIAVADRTSILSTSLGPSARRATVSTRYTGRVMTGVSGTFSSTEPDSGLAITRTFATPFVSVRADVAGLPGGATFRLNSRVDYRYIDSPGLSEVGELRLYGAELELKRGQVGVSLGRFASRRERISGFWDGADLHVGDESVGAGVLLGVQPERNSGIPDFSRPKAAAYAYAAHRTDGVDVRGSVTGGALLSDGGAGFGGGDARISVRSGRTRLVGSVDALVDEVSNGWGLARSSARANVIQGPLSVGAAWRRSRPSVLTTTYLPTFFDVSGSTSENYTANATVAVSRLASVYADGGLYLRAGDPDGHGIGGGVRIHRVPGLDVGANLDLHVRQRDASESTYGSARLSRQWGMASLAAGYSLSRTALATRTLSTHGVDASLTAPLTRRIGLVIQGGVYGGDGLRRTSVYTALWMRL